MNTNPSALKLFTTSTPNGYKVSIFLELLGVKYDVQAIDMMASEQKEPWYLKMNPNGKIPTLQDKSTNTTISESGAILTYLADQYDKDYKFSYKPGTPEYYKQLELMYFQAAGVGPMQGQVGHFKRFAPEPIPYAIERYTSETKRLYGVLNDYLERNQENSPFLVGKHVSIADVMCIGWAGVLPTMGVPLSEYPFVEKWVKTMVAIPEVKRGLAVPILSPFFAKELLE